MKISPKKLEELKGKCRRKWTEKEEDFIRYLLKNGVWDSRVIYEEYKNTELRGFSMDGVRNKVGKLRRYENI